MHDSDFSSLLYGCGLAVFCQDDQPGEGRSTPQSETGRLCSLITEALAHHSQWYIHWVQARRMQAWAGIDWWDFSSAIDFLHSSTHPPFGFLFFSRLVSGVLQVQTTRTENPTLRSRDFNEPVCRTPSYIKCSLVSLSAVFYLLLLTLAGDAAPNRTIFIYYTHSSSRISSFPRNMHHFSPLIWLNFSEFFLMGTKSSAAIGHWIRNFLPWKFPIFLSFLAVEFFPIPISYAEESFKSWIFLLDWNCSRIHFLPREVARLLYLWAFFGAKIIFFKIFFEFFF